MLHSRLTCIAVLSGIHDDFTWDVQFSHSGELLASSCNEGIINIHSTADYTRVGTFKTPRRARDLSFNPSDSLLAVSNHGSPASVWSTSDYTCLYTLSDACVGDVVAFMSDDVLVTGDDDSVGVVRLENPQEFARVDANLSGKVCEYALAVHPPTNRIAFVKSGRCYVVDGDTYDIIRTLETGPCSVIEFDSETGNLATAESIFNHVVLWDVNTGAKKWEYGAADVVWGLSMASPKQGKQQAWWYVLCIMMKAVSALVLPPIII